jgi:hypothetical protein
MALRVFRGTFLVTIDDEQTDRDSDQPVSLEELKDYLADALQPVLDTEEYGNPVGFASAELDFDSLRELPARKDRGPVMQDDLCDGRLKC